jgi:hypothetical protein
MPAFLMRRKIASNSALLTSSARTRISAGILIPRDGELSYHIRSHSEQHERLALESDLIAVVENEGQEKSAPPQKRR